MGVQVSRRLIRHDQIRPLHQGASDSHPLLLSSGQFPWLVVQAVSQSHVFEKRGRLNLHLGHGALLHERRQIGVLKRGELGEQVVELKDKPDPPVSKFRLLLIG